MKEKKSKKQQIKELKKRVEFLEKMWNEEQSRRIGELQQQIAHLKAERTNIYKSFESGYNPYDTDYQTCSDPNSRRNSGL